MCIEKITQKKSAKQIECFAALENKQSNIQAEYLVVCFVCQTMKKTSPPSHLTFRT